MDGHNKLLVSELSKLLTRGNAHVSLADALAGLPTELRGVVPENLPYSIWQLVDHIRITQWDMLRFSTDEEHQSPKWPDEYWPKEAAPVDDDAWDGAVEQINNDRDEFISIMEHADLYAKIPGGKGQTILREALQIADHTAYHVGEIVAIRRLLKAWK